MKTRKNAQKAKITHLESKPLNILSDISAVDSRSPDREVCRPGQNWEMALIDNNMHML